VYTKLPGQTIWDVIGAVGGANGLLLSALAIFVSSLETWETKCVAESVAEATTAVADRGDAEA